MEEAKACPFCGQKLDWNERIKAYDHPIRHDVDCFFDWLDDFCITEETLLLWNRRAAE